MQLTWYTSNSPLVALWDGFPPSDFAFASFGLFFTGEYAAHTCYQHYWALECSIAIIAMIFFVHQSHTSHWDRCSENEPQYELEKHDIFEAVISLGMHRSLLQQNIAI